MVMMAMAVAMVMVMGMVMVLMGWRWQELEMMMKIGIWKLVPDLLFESNNGLAKCHVNLVFVRSGPSQAKAGHFAITRRCAKHLLWGCVGMD